MLPRTRGGWYQRLLRSFWSSLIVLCLLGAPVRPSEPGLREQAENTLSVPSRHGAIVPSFRRSSTVFSHAQSPFITPDVTLEPRPSRTTALVSLETQSARTDFSIVLTRTSRGPPVG